MSTVRLFVESSAGTGKTERIQCLIIKRLLDSPAAIKQLLDESLLISFTNTAAAELRNRTQETITHSVQALRNYTPWRNASIQAVVTQAPGTPADKIDRLFEAQAGIDRLQICTIHSLCKQLLNSHPIECGTHTGLVITSDVADLEEEAIADALAQLVVIYDNQKNQWFNGFVEKGGFEGKKTLPKAPNVARLVKLAKSVLKSDLPLHPASQPPLLDSNGAPATGRGSHETIVNWFAHEVRQRFRKRKEELGLLTTNDLIDIVDRALQPGSSLSQAISNRWNYIILDEAQDTDTAQWRILENLGPTTFIAVGDPKQSIFSFRGAHYDSLPPLKQGSAWQTNTSLNTNFRSDAPLVHSLNQFFDAGVLHGFQPVQPQHSCRLFDQAGRPTSGLFFHRANKPTTGLHKMATHLENVAEAILQELSSGLLVQDEGGTDPRPLGVQDIAVLVRTNQTAAEIRKHLIHKGIPVATASKASLLESEELRELAAVFAAIDAPNDETKVLAAALTSIVGFDNKQLNELIRNGSTSQIREQLIDTLASLRETLLVENPASVFERILDTAWPPTNQSARVRILQEPDGERRVKNLLDIVAFLSDQFWRPSGAETPALLISDWLLQASARAAQRELAEEAEQNAFSESLATDSNAVRVMTVHAAKGRQFGSVWLPEACYVVNPENFYDLGQPWRTTNQGELVLQPAILDPKLMSSSSIEDAVAEELRLLYVAGTRARYRTHFVVGAFNLPGTHKHKNRLPIGHFLGDTLPQSNDRTKGWVQDYKAEQWLDDGLRDVEDRAQKSQGVVVIEQLPAVSPNTFSPVVPQLPSTPATVVVPSPMRLTSFSSLNNLLKAKELPDNDDSAFGDSDSEKSFPKPADEEDDEIVSMAEGEPNSESEPTSNENALCIPTEILPGGPNNGDLVHRILESFLPWPGDTTDDDATRERLHQLTLATADECGVSSASIRDHLSGPLSKALRQPLGGAFNNLSLLELATAGDVTVELPFTFALNTFDPSAYQNIQTIFERHSEGDFAGFAEKLTALQNTDVRGLLTGFIDLVWQSPDGRVSLVDYKTNLFTMNGKAIMEAYSQQHLHEKMIEKSYLLQAAVYAAAVDAWLSVVNPDWNYDRDFGGVTFTFLRAMGEHTEALPGNGVFHVAVPQSLAREIAEAFGIGSRTSGGLHLEATA